MRKLILIAALVLSGCATKPAVEYRMADVPEPPVLTSCVSETAGLPDSASDGQVIQSLFSDYIQCKAKNEEALRALEAYRKPNTTTQGAK